MNRRHLINLGLALAALWFLPAMAQETPKPEPPKPETPAPEAPKADAPAPAPKPDAPAPEAPKPDAAKTETPAPAPTQPAPGAPTTGAPAPAPAPSGTAPAPAAGAQAAPAAATQAAPAPVAPAQPAAPQTQPLTKATLAVDGSAKSDGAIDLFVGTAPEKMAKLHITVVKGTSDKDIAQDIWKEIKLTLGETYKISRSGSSITIKAPKNGQFRMSIAAVTPLGVGVKIE